MKAGRLILLVSLLFLTACGGGSGPPSSPTQASAYIQNKGSDTMVNLALAWAERYQAEHPDISLSVTGGGSGTGIAALVNGTVDIANASRAMTSDEIKQAEANGITPVEFVVSRDAIAVIVNSENPVRQLTLQQISDIYSGKINNWSEVGGDNRPIVRLSRETNSGTHVYFLQTVIRLGDTHNKTLFSTDTLLLASSEGIVNEVRQNPNAIGYDGLGYVPPDLMNSVIAVARESSGPYVIPSIATVNDNSYPVARDLYMYTAGEPAGAIKDYIDWILSPEAQAIVADLGFVPIATTSIP
jgi:phosphate transport system substrate-binding protein